MEEIDKIISVAKSHNIIFSAKDNYEKLDAKICGYSNSFKDEEILKFKDSPFYGCEIRGGCNSYPFQDLEEWNEECKTFILSLKYGIPVFGKF